MNASQTPFYLADRCRNMARRLDGPGYPWPARVFDILTGVLRRVGDTLSRAALGQRGSAPASSS